MKKPFNPQQEHQEQLTEALFSINFPTKHIPTDFKEWLHQALRKESHHTLQCKWETFKKLLNWASSTSNEITLYDMSFAINAVDCKTLEQMNTGQHAYIDMMDEVDAMQEEWNKIADPIKLAVQQRIQKLVEAEQARMAAQAKLLGGKGGQNGKRNINFPVGQS